MAVRFSTAEVGRRSQLDYWREVVCATFFALDVERGGPSRTGFRGEITARSLDQLRIATVSSEPHAVIRSAERIRQSYGDDFVVNLAVRGRVMMTQHRFDAVLNPGDFCHHLTSPRRSGYPSATSICCSRRKEHRRRAGSWNSVSSRPAGCSPTRGRPTAPSPTSRSASASRTRRISPGRSRAGMASAPVSTAATTGSKVRPVIWPAPGQRIAGAGTGEAGAAN